MIEYTYVVVELGDWWVFEQTNFLICLVLNIWYNQRIQTFVQFNPVDGFQNLGEIANRQSGTKKIEGLAFIVGCRGALQLGGPCKGNPPRV